MKGDDGNQSERGHLLQRNTSVKRHILIIVLIGLFTETIDRTKLRSGERLRLHVGKLSQMSESSGSCATIELVLILFFVVQ